MTSKETPLETIDSLIQKGKGSPRGREKPGVKTFPPLQPYNPDSNSPPLPSRASCPSYTHERMIQLILDNPDWTHAEYARYFGRRLSWFSTVIASDAFQHYLDPVRHLIPDPYITASMQERMRGLAIHAVEVLQEKLSCEEIQDFTVLKALEVGAKSLGMGAAIQPPAPKQEEKGVEALADRLVSALNKARNRSDSSSAVDVEVKES